MATASELGIDALHTIQSTEPPVWLAPTEELSRATRLASCYLFSSLKPSCPKSPFEHLLVDGFDAEQIWQQIDLQSQPLLLSLRTEVNKFEKNPEEIRTTKNIVEKKIESKDSQDEAEDSDMDMDGFDGEDEDSEQEENENEKAQERGVEASETESEEEEEEEGEEKGIEDKFLKIKELQEYLEEGEAEEFGLDKTNKKKKGNARRFDDSDKEDEEDNGMEDEDEDEDEEEDEEELEGIDALGDEVEDEDTLENARYKDFFGSNKKLEKRKSSDSRKNDNDSDGDAYQDKETLSTHEKTLQKLKSKIEVMEKANLDPKHWTLQGEVTAAKRAKNSALEVELDFEHNVRPAPVITEEVTTSLEDMIKKRILEGQYDDVEKARNLPEKAPRERKELDDNKSKKGLAEVYEEKYVENTNPAFAPTSHSDELKKEASMLFKKVCLKLDALSHFHFTPKPVIEDMSIQVNVPALAMEEIAPVAVSDAAMLAPEEIFAGKGDFKEEAELTQANRKRRRANKKRKFKAEGAKRMAKNGQSNTASIKKAEDE